MKRFSLLMLILLVLIISGCINQAPGCIYQLPFVRGGCYSKFVIKNPTTYPQIDCIKFDINNCNNPDLSLKNTCSENVYIKSDVIPSEIKKCYKPYQNYYFDKDFAGNVKLVSSKKCLGKNEIIDSNGSIGNSTFSIYFVIEDNKIKENLQEIDPLYQKCVRFIGRGIGCSYLRLETWCNETIEIAGKRIEPKKIECKTYPGSKKIAEHFSAPNENQNYEIEGKIGEKEFTVSYTVTKELC